MKSWAAAVLALPRPVWLLGWVSFFTDAATEAIYPLLPFFLTRVLGAGAVSLGLIEGIAEAANSVLKIVSGRLSDRTGHRKPIVLVGYGISSAVRPFIALARAWPQVLALRFFDRVGKGIRGAPRDAMLADWADAGSRGLTYGLQRAMDHAGAVVGPLVATAFLLAYPGRYRTLFALTAIPGAIAVFLLTRVPEDTAGEGRPEALPHRDGAKETPAPSLALPTLAGKVGVGGWRALPGELHRFLLVLAVFTLGNSTDAFLLLRLTDAAGSAAYIPILWSLLHVVKAGASVVGGGLSDRLGRQAMIAAGWLVYAIVYAGFAVSEEMVALVGWFLIYGLYFGLTEGAERALVADLAPRALGGTAFGFCNAVVGFGALLASVAFGLLWTSFGAAVAFGSGAALALLAIALLFTLVGSSAKR